MKRFIAFPLFVFVFSLVFYNCSKEDENSGSPSLSLRNTTGYTSKDTSVNYGDTIRLGVIATGNGSDNLRRFVLQVNDEVLLDSTINTQNFTFNFYTIKGPNQIDSWKMKVTDAKDKSAEKTIILTGIFGEINNYSEILLGAQSNESLPGFLSISGNVASLFNQVEAFNHQPEIDMFCYYDQANGMSLASPGSNVSGIFTGDNSPENYTTKNLTWFVKTTLTSSNYEAVQNDGIIREFYNDHNKTNKAQLLIPGNVYAFRLQSGKLGLMKIIQVNGSASGSIKLAVKIQK